MKKITLGLALISIFFSGCLKSSETSTNNNCNYDPCALKASASEIQNVQSYLAANNITGTTQHCSGLFYSIDNPGTGVSPTVCSNIEVSYVGKLTNGTVFDSVSTSSPAIFNLIQAIPGWKNGLPLIKVGGTIHLYIPPTLAYGSSGYSSIPPNAILVFRVDLMGVQ